MNGHSVFIVDDDISVLKSLSRLLLAHGYRAITFGSAQEFLSSKSYRHAGPSCMVLDVRLPGINGIDLHREFLEKGISLPVIFITGHGDIPMGVQAMKRGAVDFLTKPFVEDDLVSAIRRAIEKDIKIKKARNQADKVTKLVNTLTAQERVVLSWVITGSLNKQIARQLGITEKTVKVHRGRVMQKMQAGSVAELVRLCQKADIPAAKRSA
jgi:FixJ family two-component response regulator